MSSWTLSRKRSNEGLINTTMMSTIGYDEESFQDHLNRLEISSFAASSTTHPLSNVWCLCGRCDKEGKKPFN